MADDLSPVTEVPFGRFVVQIAWIAARFMMAYYLGHSDYFFYQGF